MCHVIILRAKRNIRPITNATPQTSPIHPAPEFNPGLPRSILKESGSLSNIEGSPAFTACFIMERGVAPVVASVYFNSCPAIGQLVIYTGKDMSRKARATKTGLNGLHPKPPKVIFATPIATRAPIIIIHTGRFDGKLNPSNSPVRIAEPSLIVERLRLRMYFVMNHSKNTHEMTLVAHTIADPIPK